MSLILTKADAQVAASKPCAQCANYVADGMCSAEGQVIVDVVTGASEPHNKPCEPMRRSGQLCGTDAKLFAPKEVVIEILRPSIGG